LTSSSSALSPFLPWLLSGLRARARAHTLNDRNTSCSSASHSSRQCTRGAKYSTRTVSGRSRQGKEGLAQPPLRLLLGSDGARAVEQADLARAEADRKWRDLRVSTDFEASIPPTTKNQ
jgi:hypothetical protein